MMRYESSVVVNRPIEEVWAFMTDPFNLPRIGSGTLGVRVTAPGPIGVGTTGHMRVVIFGLEARVGGAITEWDPPHAVAFSVKGAGLRSFSLRATLESTADGTKVVRVLEYEPRPAFKLFWWIALPFLRRSAHAHNQNFKRLLESGRG